MQDWDSPVSSGPPTYPSERPYWTTGQRWRLTRIKIEARNDNQVQGCEMAYLECAHTAQPPWNTLKCACDVVGPPPNGSLVADP